MSKKSKNRIKTGGYFLKRLKDSGFETWKIFNNYDQSDSRRWTLLVDPGGVSVYITCREDRVYNDITFEFNDGGQYFRQGMVLKTESMEVIIRTLIENGVSQKNQKESIKE